MTMTEIKGLARSRTPAQLFAFAFGAVYLLVGLCGFLVTGMRHFASLPAATFIVFSVNPLHNIVHVALGAAWLVGWHRPATARSVNVVVGGVLGLVTILGFAGLLRPLGIESVGDPDNFLHLATAVLSLYFGSAGAYVHSGSHPADDEAAASPW